jgi:heat shock protein 4
MSNLTAVGFDIGSQKTMIVAEDGEIIRTSTGKKLSLSCVSNVANNSFILIGSVARPTLVSFAGKHRLFGEEALAQISADSTIPLLNLMVGRELSEIQSMPCFVHSKLNISSDKENRLITSVNFQENEEDLHVTSLFGMLLRHLYEEVHKAYGNNAVVCFPLHPNASNSVARAYKEAAQIAGLEENKIFLADSSDCLVATYARKITGLGGAEKCNLIGKNVILIDMGHTETTVVAVRYNDKESTLPQKLGVAFDENLGAYHFDLKLFEHFAHICEVKHKVKILPGTKQGKRLLAGCERIRKLLSQLSESEITVERLIEDNDMHFHLKRDDMAELCLDLLNEKGFNGLMNSVFTQMGSTTVEAVEVVGGGVRMPVIQVAINKLVGENIPLGAKLDDGSVALGAALIYRKQQNDLKKVPAAPPVTASEEAAAENKTEQPPAAPAESTPMEVTAEENASSKTFQEIKIKYDESNGLSSEEINKAIEKELFYQSKDQEVHQLHAAYNKLESYILEMRNAPKRKFGELIDSSALNKKLDDHENWLWENADNASLATFEEKYQSLTNEIHSLCANYFEKVNEEKLALEKMLNEESEKAAKEKELEGGDDEDHDTRKLKKGDRMRLVVKNKDEGNELFKGGNYRPAAARYHKALTHASKFFDLTPEDENEVKNLKISLFNNLATCYFKLENYEHLLNNIKEVLKLDENNVKALFRYSQYYEWKKDYEKSLEYLLLAEKWNPVEDKLVTKNVEKMKKEIGKMKDREKKMWGKAFA